MSARQTFSIEAASGQWVVVLVNVVRREVMRLKAISRQLSELNYAPLQDEADMLEVTVAAMLRKLEQPPYSSAAEHDLPKAG